MPFFKKPIRSIKVPSNRSLLFFWRCYTSCCTRWSRFRMLISSKRSLSVNEWKSERRRDGPGQVLEFHSLPRAVRLVFAFYFCFISRFRAISLDCLCLRDRSPEVFCLQNQGFSASESSQGFRIRSLAPDVLNPRIRCSLTPRLPVQYPILGAPEIDTSTCERALPF